MKTDFLTKSEISNIEAFCKNEEMFEAVKKVILQSIYSHGVMKKGEKHNPLQNRAMALVGGDSDNEKLGSQIRAWWEGVNALEIGYSELKKIKNDKEELGSEINEAI